jgi:NADH-quinone oxidoreductase subunit L
VKLVPLLVLLPAAASVVGLAVGRSRVLAASVAVVGTAASLAVAVVAGLRTWGDVGVVDVWATVPTGWISITISTRADALGLTVAVMVGAVALAVQVYSVSYMADQPRYGTYASFVSLFTAAMLLVVVADDLIVLLVGWEVMGLCSYLLIGQLWELPEARAAAVKAFVVTRLGDIGLLFGIFVLGEAAGSFQVSQLQLAVVAGALTPSTVVTVSTLLVLCGVVGKSAQVPLHVWLPDAMAGPTPVSALIHAATMVAAGVFLVARLYDVFLLSPTALAVLAVIASVTMLGAALAALAQDDLKRVLAYSTASQLAYMFAGLSVGGYDAGLLHLLSHAAYKALLFLCAGVVIHVVGSNLLSAMGGLRGRTPVAFATMTLGFAALAGVPPFSGFFSKESVIGAAEEAAIHGGGPTFGWASWLVVLSALATVLVTAAYVARAWLLTFFGPPAPVPAETMENRTEAAASVGNTRHHSLSEAGETGEAPALMRLPLMALAIPTVLVAVLAFMPQPTRTAFAAVVELPAGTILPDVVTPVQELPTVGLSAITTVLSLVLVAIGAFGTYVRWRQAPGTEPVTPLGALRRVFAAGFGVDRLYDAVFVRPVNAMARGVVLGDRDVVEPSVRGSGRAVSLFGGLVRRLQRGEVQGYASVVLAAVVVLALAGVTLA